MNCVLKTAVLFTAVVASFCVEAQNPRIEWVRGTDFVRFQTFTWASAAYDIQDLDANAGMARIIRSELERKKMHFVSAQNKFDVFLTYNATINPDTRDLSQNVLTLNVRIFDARNNSVIWSAGGYVALTRDRTQNVTNTRKMLHEMFQQYPPK